MYGTLKKGALVRHKHTGRLATITAENITIITHGEWHGHGDIDDTEVSGGISVVWLSDGETQGRSQKIKYKNAYRSLEVIDENYQHQGEK